MRNAIDLWALAYTKAASPRDPDHPLAAASMTGGLLENFRRDAAEKKANGLIARRPDDQPMRHFTLTVRFDTPDKAVVIDCFIDDFVQYREATMEPVDTSVTSMLSTVTLLRGPDGVWRTAERSIDLEEDGEAMCESYR